MSEIFVLSDAPLYQKAARQFGAEVIANGGNSRYPNRDERADIAHYWESDKEWRDMSEDIRKAALAAWWAGIKAEEEASNAHL